MKKNKLKISIIIPIFNHSGYIFDCLQSVINQKDEFYEIIAIDDGSVDDSYEKAKKYLTGLLPEDMWQLTTRENKGINRTLNEGIGRSSGQVIYLLASDDRMAPCALNRIRDYYTGRIWDFG